MDNLAKDYHNYITYRMKILGLENGLELSLDFYKRTLNAGNTFIFGVYNNGKKMTSDIHFPELFAKWKLRNKY